MSHLILGKFALEHLFYSTLPWIQLPYATDEVLTPEYNFPIKPRAFTYGILPGATPGSDGSA